MPLFYHLIIFKLAELSLFPKTCKKNGDSQKSREKRNKNNIHDKNKETRSEKHNVGVNNLFGRQDIQVNSSRLITAKQLRTTHPDNNKKKTDMSHRKTQN